MSAYQKLIEKVSGYLDVPEDWELCEHPNPSLVFTDIALMHKSGIVILGTCNSKCEHQRFPYGMSIHVYEKKKGFSRMFCYPREIEIRTNSTEVQRKTYSVYLTLLGKESQVRSEKYAKEKEEKSKKALKILG